MRSKKIVMFCLIGVLLLAVSVPILNGIIRHRFEVRKNLSLMKMASSTIADDLARFKKQRKLGVDESYEHIEFQYCQWAPVALVRYDKAFETLTNRGGNPVEVHEVTEARDLVVELRSKFDLPDYQTDERYRESLISVSNGRVLNAPPSFHSQSESR